MSGRSSDPASETPTDVAGTAPSREAVRDCLDCVTDPELDRSIVELEYIDQIRIDDGAVEITFTLPTAWCSPAFAWMMATDARDEIASLPETESVRIELHDHMHETQITRGVNEHKSFESMFPDADGGVTEVRATLDDKARFARQHEAVAACLDAGLDAEQIVALRRGDIELTEDACTVSVSDIHVVVAADPIEAYLEKASASGYVVADDDRLFLTPDGDPIPRERFEIVQKRTRLAGVNMGGQGAVCDALNSTRREKLGRN